MQGIFRKASWYVLRYKLAMRTSGLASVPEYPVIYPHNDKWKAYHGSEICFVPSASIKCSLTSFTDILSCSYCLSLAISAHFQRVLLHLEQAVFLLPETHIHTHALTCWLKRLTSQVSYPLCWLFLVCIWFSVTSVLCEALRRLLDDGHFNSCQRK